VKSLARADPTLPSNGAGFFLPDTLSTGPIDGASRLTQHHDALAENSSRAASTAWVFLANRHARHLRGALPVAGAGDCMLLTQWRYADI
jgi:hypothetical protein